MEITTQKFRELMQKGTYVEAGSVVTKSVPANTIAVGNPARVIKKIEVNYE